MWSQPPYILSQPSQPPDLQSLPIQALNLTEQVDMLNREPNLLSHVPGILIPRVHPPGQLAKMLLPSESKQPAQNNTANQDSASENWSCDNKGGLVLPNVPCDNKTMVFPENRTTQPKKRKSQSQPASKPICPQCGRLCNSMSHLKEHLNTVHTDEKRFQCLDCQKRYKSRSALTNHQKSHGHGRIHGRIDMMETVKLCLCENCGASFSSTRILQEHKKKYAENGMSCAKQLLDGHAEALKERKSAAGRKKRIINNPVYREDEKVPEYLCGHCGQYFYTQSQLLEHKRDEHGVMIRKRYTGLKCHHCGKQFALKEQLTTHLNKYKWSETKKKCPGFWSLPRTMNSYQCALCMKKYISIHTLRVHLKSHENTKPRGSRLPKKFKCDICSQRYVCHKGFKRHLRRHQGQDLLGPIEERQRYQCSICKNKLTSKRGLIYHLVLHYRRPKLYKLPKKYKCQLCCKQYACPKALKKHVCLKGDQDKAMRSPSGNRDSTQVDMKSNKVAKVQSKTLKVPDHKVATQLPSKMVLDSSPTLDATSKTPKIASKILIKAENKQEMHVGMDISSIQVDLNLGVMLKHESVKQEPPEIVENEVDQMFDMTCESLVEPEQNETLSELEQSELPSTLGHNGTLTGIGQCHSVSESNVNNDIINEQVKTEFEASEIIWECKFCKTCFLNRQEHDKHIRTAHVDLAEAHGDSEKCGEIEDIPAITEGKAEGQSSLVCAVCKIHYSNRLEYGEHIRNIHADPSATHLKGRLKCRLCEKHYDRPNRLARHVATHLDHQNHQTPRYKNNQVQRKKPSGVTENQTETGNAKQNSITDLSESTELPNKISAGVKAGDWDEAEQVATQISEGTYNQYRLQCENCLRYFSSKTGLTKHIKTTHPEVYKTWESPAYTCIICDKSFTKPSRLKVHQETVHKELQGLVKTENEVETKWRCEKCSRFFANQAAWTNHYRIEHPKLFKTLKKPVYTCTICGKDWKSPSKLAKHVETHNKPKKVQGGVQTKMSIKCEIEGGTGSINLDSKVPDTNLKHEVSDAGQVAEGNEIASELGMPDMPIECGDCNMRFTNGVEYNSHRCMGSQGDLQCAICDMHFTTTLEKVTHIRSVHQINQVTFKIKSEAMGHSESTREMSEIGGIADIGFKSQVSETPPNPLERSKMKFRCAICNASFQNVQEKKRHIQKSHAYKCQYCPRHFNTRRRLAKHTTTHNQIPSTGKRWVCVGCAEGFPTRAELTSHILNEHAELSTENGNSIQHDPLDLTCSGCERIFANKAALTYHLRLSHPDIYKTIKQPSYKCKLCAKCFNKPYKLAAHAATHTRTSTSKPSSWDCPGCEEHYVTKDALVSHIRDIHADPQYFPGNQSDNSSNIEFNNSAKQSAENQSNVKNEGNRSKTNSSGTQSEDSLKCLYCDAVYDRPLRLAQHTTSHTGYKKYKCKECSYGAHDKMTLLGHVRQHHTHELPHQCPWCGLQFALSGMLNKHLRRKHPNTLGPVKPRPWRRRLGEKPKISCRYKGIFPCRICGKIYFYSSPMHEHVRSVHLGIRHPCVMCGKSFATKSILSDHVKVAHSNVKKYQCARCGQKFALRNQLKKHEDRIRKCAPVLSGSIGLDGVDSFRQQTNDSIGQKGNDAIGHQASNLVGQWDNYSISQRVYSFVNHGFIGQQAISSIAQQTIDSIGHQTVNSAGQQQNDPIGHHADDSIGRVEKPKIHPCDLCSKSFTSKQGLHFHRQGQHLGERKYKCLFSGCNKAFTKMNVLREHERLHSDVYGFQCQKCGQKFKQRNSYYAHKKRKTDCVKT